MALEMAVRQRRLPPQIDAGWSDVRLSGEACSRFWVEHQIEQSPEVSNRVCPSARRDKFGRAEVELAWKWSDLDLRSLETSVDLFGRAVEAAGLGEFEPYPWDEDGPNVTSTNGSFHPMGTTRMSEDPKRGVVDVDLRLHGTQNLFVLGSSIFPTGGYATPAFTVIALSIRLGDLLKREFTRTTIPEA
jgi:choline dehydrogenase-like flavoprotein